MAKSTKLKITNIDDAKFEVAGGSIGAKSGHQSDKDIDIEIEDIKKSEFKVAGVDIVSEEGDWKQVIANLRQEIITQVDESIKREFENVLADVEVMLEAEQPTNLQQVEATRTHLANVWEQVKTAITLTPVVLESYERLHALILQLMQ